MAAEQANLAAVLASDVGDRSDRPFLRVPGGTTHTYAEVDRLAARFAAALAAAGAYPGDRILVQVAKSPAAVALYLACLRGGFVHVPVNPAATTDELGWFVADAEPAVLVADPAFVTDVSSLHAVGAVLTLDRDGTGSLPDQATSGADNGPVADRASEDPAAILYTSGTTGRPKGAVLSHGALRHNAEVLHRTWRFSADDVLLHVLPIFHVHGLFVALHCAMLSAIPVWLCPRFDVEATLALLPRSTVMMGVPTHYVRLLADPRFDAARTASIRLLLSGSAPMSTTTFESLLERTGHHVCERYGMSEAGIITSNPYDGPRLAGTVGHSLPGIELRVTVDGRSVDPGITGTVEIRSPGLLTEYWRRPDATAAMMRDGWFVTGDVGRLDPDGRLTLEGRSGDTIITGGENVYPKEIELALDTVAGVGESAVIGVPHPDLGEAVVALVVDTPGETATDTDIADALAGLARHKHPRAVRHVDALPRNTMGKVQKQVLRTTWAGLFDPPTGA